MTAIAGTADAPEADSRKIGKDLGEAPKFRDRGAFAAQVAQLRAGGGTLNLSEKTLMVVGGVVAPLGLLVVLLGWVGASKTSNIFEQIPYMISGGLFGLGLVFLGSFFYFAHWMTELLREQRRQTELLLEAIRQTSDDETVRDAILALEHRLLEAAEPAPRRSTKRKAKPRSKRRASA